MAGRGDIEVSGESSNTFEFKDELSSLVLVVEGKKLYVNRMYLALCSSVFKRMLYEGALETEVQEIELPGKKHKDIVELLLQIHPVHSLRNVWEFTEDSLFALVSLAQEYQVEHVLRKYQAFLGTPGVIACMAVDKILLNLCLCVRCHFQREKDLLKGMAIQKHLNLAKSRWYQYLDNQMICDIMDTVERHLEEKRQWEMKKREEQRQREMREREEQRQREMREREEQRQLEIIRERLRSSVPRKSKKGCTVN